MELGPVTIYDEFCDSTKEDIYAGIEAQISNSEKPQDLLKQSPTLECARIFAEQRKNVLCWYPFKDGSRILTVGDECGSAFAYKAEEGYRVVSVVSTLCSAKTAARTYNKTNRLTLYAGDAKKILSSLTDKFDYIIIFPEYVNRQIIKTAEDKRNDGGKMIIVADNPVGLRYLSGVKDVNSTVYGRAITGAALNKNGLENMLKETGFENYKFYYPYPDYRFTETVYTDEALPQNENLRSPLTVFDGDRIRLFDEEKVQAEIIAKGEFARYANSYIIETGDSFADVKFAKVSCERNSRYRVCTIISHDDNGKECIRKTAVGSAAKQHIKRIEKSFEKLSRYYEYTDFEICPCVVEDNTAVFDFVQGRPLSALIAQAVNNKDDKALTDCLETLKRAVMPLSMGRSFSKSFKFRNFFGNLKLPDGLNATKISNADLIDDNIIVGKKTTIIDYEWILDFPVPLEFILYRSVLHSKALNSLPIEKLDTVYELLGIPKSAISVFLKMEQIFQYRISGEVMRYDILANTVSNKVLDINLVNVDDYVYTLRIADGDNRNKVYGSCNAYDDDISFGVSLPIGSSETICIMPCEKPAVIKNISVWAKLGEEKVNIYDFTTNAYYENDGAYYFTENPVITVKNADYGYLAVSLSVTRRGGFGIRETADLIKIEKADKEVI